MLPTDVEGKTHRARVDFALIVWQSLAKIVVSSSSSSSGRNDVLHVVIQFQMILFSTKLCKQKSTKFHPFHVALRDVLNS